MLLGAMCTLRQGTHALDAGSGSGVLGLMVAQKFPSLTVDCIELDPLAFNECKFNLQASPFNHRMEAICEDLIEFIPDYSYDLIITNPPYYLSNNPSSEKNKREKHSDLPSLLAWLNACKHLLSTAGCLWLILPEATYEALKPHLETIPLYEDKVISIFNQHQKRIRIVLSLHKTAGKRTDSSFVLRKINGDYTEEYLALTQAFHRSPPKR